MLRAVAEQSVAGGLLLLGGAGVGTMPGLLAAGLAGSAIRARWQVVGTKVLGGLVILLGLAMLLRRLGLLPGGDPGACH
jgi:sulfite exporter TauE/SafE